VSEVESLGGRAVALPADMADATAPARVIQQTIDHFGTLDILVCNAGAGSAENLRPLVNFSDDFWNYSLAVNLTAPYLLCKAAVPILAKKHWGRIIMIASLASKTGLVHGAAYAASKHGLLGLAKTLAMEVAQDGITVNSICPGPVKTKINEIRTRYDAERLGLPVEEWETRMNLIRRRLEPEEIVPMAILLASEEAAAITGQAYNICGGAIMF
jgi:3-hydroxybutyrate dehydrogenase